MSEEQTSKHFYNHIYNGKIYLLEKTWHSDLISSEGQQPTIGFDLR